MRKIVLIAVILTASMPAARADTDAQRVTRGGIFPIFVNGVGTTQVNAKGGYVNQTQIPAAPSSIGSRAALVGIGR